LGPGVIIAAATPLKGASKKLYKIAAHAAHKTSIEVNVLRAA